MSKQQRQKQRIGLIIAFLVLGYFASQFSPEKAYHAEHPKDIISVIQNKQSHVPVTLTAQVSRVLPDDLDGSRHQRFILTLGDGHTILVAHNIDLAPRIQGLKAGDIITVSGEYIWNEKGGMLHWTHHDPKGKRTGGWIEYQGQVYQ